MTNNPADEVQVAKETCPKCRLSASDAPGWYFARGVRPPHQPACIYWDGTNACVSCPTVGLENGDIGVIWITGMLGFLKDFFPAVDLAGYPSAMEQMGRKAYSRKEIISEQASKIARLEWELAAKDVDADQVLAIGGPHWVDEEIKRQWRELREETAWLKLRLRKTAQTIIAAIGANGPENAEDAAERIAARLKAAEQQLAAALKRAALADRLAEAVRDEVNFQNCCLNPEPIMYLDELLAALAAYAKGPTA